VIEKRETGHTVRLGVDIDKAAFTTYAADGLIIATPTGSTAYSMSARGPILSPRLRAMLVTPVSPHMLFDRSMVLDGSEVARVEVLGHRQVNVAIDGELVHTLHTNDVVEVRAAKEVARFMRFEERRFHQILKTKGSKNVFSSLPTGTPNLLLHTDPGNKIPLNPTEEVAPAPKTPTKGSKKPRRTTA
jgi:NAD+ kinase